MSDCTPAIIQIVVSISMENSRVLAPPGLQFPLCVSSSMERYLFHPLYPTPIPYTQPSRRSSTARRRATTASSIPGCEMRYWTADLAAEYACCSLVAVLIINAICTGVSLFICSTTNVASNLRFPSPLSQWVILTTWRLNGMQRNYIKNDPGLILNVGSKLAVFKPSTAEMSLS